MASLPDEKGRAILRHLQTCFFLALLAFNCSSSVSFLKLVHFRALSGWTDELAFDSLSFDWSWINGLWLGLNAAVLAGVVLAFVVGGFYRLYGPALALVFLLDAVYPWGLAFHYVRSFHSLLILGILMNACGFGALYFFRRALGLLEKIPEREGSDE